MSDFQVKVEGVSFVALGSFNPAIFQPFWFAENELISREEAERASIDIVHNDATAFRTEWFTINVLANRCQFETIQPQNFPVLRDLVVNTFSILEHTPITAFGLNFFQHMQVDSIDAWHEFGHFLIPKTHWTSVLQNPGTRKLVVQGNWEGRLSQYVEIKVEPSKVVGSGIFFHVNEHFIVPESDKSHERTAFVMETTQSAWDTFLKLSVSTVNELIQSFNRDRS